MPLRKLDRTIPFSQRIKATSEPGPQLMEEKSSIVTPKKPPNQILSFARALLCIYRFENRNDFFVQTFGSSRPWLLTVRWATKVSVENLKNSQLVKNQAPDRLRNSVVKVVVS
ncbi:hypothetical protein BFJ63_vAg1410 [Fusarium oxysporum f. sp. narcissi]|uniref:Uncharacterized protein n=2 Tax=Fusarium oxysporum TaxID=5507 RepID=A0A420PYV1_FUSOX|nr:hypothetical protein BFJ68_g13901 [Fusarium oxysporum]RYC95594.1 hypothetical protein BFJ63_vAg1410 [Fusarium oxysporum f. sp. narcissi]